MSHIDIITLKILLRAQKDEINSYNIYRNLAKRNKNEHNAKILSEIAKEEKKHYHILKKITKKEVKASRFKIILYTFILRVFGLTFGIRLMERGEGEAQIIYSEIMDKFPEIESMLKDEEKHENQLIEMLDEEMLDYIGSIVLGLSDALVELTGALAGFTLAFQDTVLIAVIGLITGISASLSMGASEYLATSEEDLETKSPFKASLYTGSAYIFTVIILITPFFLIENNPNLSLVVSIFAAIVIIFIFTFYISIAKSIPFKQRFAKITTVTISVAALSLLIGMIVKIVFKIDI